MYKNGKKQTIYLKKKIMCCSVNRCNSEIAATIFIRLTQ